MMKKWLLSFLLLVSIPVFSKNGQGTVPDSLVLQLQQATGEDLERVKALNNIVGYYVERNEIDHAKPYVEEISRIAESLHSDYVKTVSCYYVIAYYIKANDYEAVVPYLHEIHVLLDRLDDNDKCNQLRGSVYDLLALFYYDHDMLPQAYENLNQCFQINQKLNDTSIDFQQNYRLMMLLKSMQQFDEAISVGKKLAGRQTKERSMTYYHLGMVNCYIAMSRYDSAMMHIDSALLCDQSHTLQWLINDQKGQILLDNSRFDEAFACFDQERAALSESYIQPEDSLYIEFRTCWSQAYYYYNSHRYDSALYFVNRSLETVHLYGSLGDELTIMSLKTGILHDAGRYEDALDNIMESQVLRDSLTKQRNVQNVEALMFQQQMKDYEAEQQYQNQLQEHKHRVRFMVMAFIAALSLLGVVILLLTIKKRKLEAKVTEEELELRNRELTEATVVMMKKNEAYTEVIGQLSDIKDNTNDKNAKKAIDRVSKKIEQTMDDGYYGEFSVRFKQVHPDFIEKLTKKHPDLTPNEIKICSFLKLNMSTKEIAALTGQSVAAIEMARYRIRRKLGISTDDHRHLSNYLLRI